MPPILIPIRRLGSDRPAGLFLRTHRHSSISQLDEDRSLRFQGDDREFR